MTDEKLKRRLGTEELVDDTEADYPDLAPLRRPDPTREPRPQPEVRPGDMAIATSKERVLVVIRPNGQLLFGPDYVPDEAAEIFWSSMALKRIGSERRLRLLAEMESVLTQLGSADMANETARRNFDTVQSTESTEEDLESARLRCNEAHTRLETAVHNAIEFARKIIPEPELTAIPRPTNRSVH